VGGGGGEAGNTGRGGEVSRFREGLPRITCNTSGSFLVMIRSHPARTPLISYGPSS